MVVMINLFESKSQTVLMSVAILLVLIFSWILLIFLAFMGACLIKSIYTPSKNIITSMMFHDSKVSIAGGAYFL